jgi:hypothetical protein
LQCSIVPCHYLHIKKNKPITFSKLCYNVVSTYEVVGLLKITREITRLDITSYHDPAANLGSKPQNLGATNCKNSTSDKLQTFRAIFDISCKCLTKNYLHEIPLFVLKGISCKRNYRTFQEN